MNAVLLFLISAIKNSMPFLLGSTGETLTEKSGHLNLGIPGIMCVGAAGGCMAEAIYVESCGGISKINPVIGVIIAIVAAFLFGGAMGVIYSFLTVTLRANQNVTGLALTTLGTGISRYIISTTEAEFFGQTSKFFTAAPPFKDSLGWFTQLFFSYGTLIYLSFVIAIVTAIVLKKTRIGLNLRAVGENPATADAAGISVSRYRYIATIIGSGIAGLGGLCYIMDSLNGSWEYTIDAIGWLSIALVIFTLWSPDLGIIGSIVFGVLYTVGNYIPGLAMHQKKLIEMLPYAVTIIVLIITSVTKNKNSQPPEALGLNYFREER